MKPNIKSYWDRVDAMTDEELDTSGIPALTSDFFQHPLPPVSGADALAYLMGEHGLTQSALPEVGYQGVVSEILHGKRKLNVRQIRVLAERFEVSPAVFF